MMYTRAMANALFGAVVATALAASAGVLPWESAGGGFEQALGPRAWVFPRDHGPHPSFAHEWWYLTGHLQGPGGERFGFELTFFRVGLPGVASEPATGASHWRTRQMFVAHFALTEIGRQQFHSEERYARDALGLSGAQADPARVWLDDWSLELAGTSWRLQAQQPGYALELAMTPALAPVLNGDAGLSQKSANPADASYYYSIPRLSAEGRLVRNGEPLAVHGTAWLDREWGSGGLAADEAGWDWFALQFADGSELMFYALRRRDGTLEPHSAGTWVSPQARSQALASADVRISVLKSWQSPRGGRYPARWRLEVPSLGLAVDLRPAVANQELNGRPRYWEGAVEVAGARGTQSIAGEGYVELVGYATPGERATDNR
jgi:predicted secreted hydrolase